MMKPVVLLLLVAPLLVSSEVWKLRDCSDILKRFPKSTSGVYPISPDLKSKVWVYCDMKDGAWTVIQRRKDGTVNFYRPWYQYVAGFGNAHGEYWLGLENMHKLTMKPQILQVEMEDFAGNKASARYHSFSIGAECEGYKLSVSGFKNGGAGDGLSVHNGMKFSTFDKDQDAYRGNCAQLYFGAWWYRSCYICNLNGVYRWGADTTHAVIAWSPWRGDRYSLKSVTMKIKPSD